MPHYAIAKNLISLTSQDYEKILYHLTEAINLNQNEVLKQYGVEQAYLRYERAKSAFQLFSQKNKIELYNVQQQATKLSSNVEALTKALLQYKKNRFKSAFQHATGLVDQMIDDCVFAMKSERQSIDLAKQIAAAFHQMKEK